MSAYITPDNSYYEGDKASVVDTQCAKRPDGQVFTGTVSLDAAVMWRPKTSIEIDNERSALAEAMANGDPVARAVFLMLFDHENRIRVLEGRQQLTKLQYAVSVNGVYKSVL